MKQIEQKFKKKEQLNIKEAILNDSTSEKSRLLNRLFKAEARNMELEMTIKTLNSNVHEPTDSNVHRVNVLNNTPTNAADNSSSTNTTNYNTSCDDLVEGIMDRVTRFVLSKIDAELDKLQNGDQNNQIFSRPLNDPYVSRENHHLRQQTHSYQYVSNLHQTPYTSSSQLGDGGAFHNVPSDYTVYNIPHQNHYQTGSAMVYSPHDWGYWPVDQLVDGGTCHNVPTGSASCVP